MYFFSESVYYWPAWETINTNQICVPCAEDIIDGDFFKDSCRLCFTYYGANILSISCTKLVISCKASIFFSHAWLHSSIFSPYCDSFWHKLSQYGKKNTVYLCIPYSLLPGEIWSLVWDHWFRAWDAQCMCTITRYFIFMTEAEQRWAAKTQVFFTRVPQTPQAYPIKKLWRVRGPSDAVKRGVSELSMCLFRWKIK